MKYHLLKEEQNFLIGHCYLLLHLIKMMIPILKAFVWRTTRDTHACVWEKKRHDWKWPVCLLLSLLAWFWPFRPGYSLSCLCLAFLILCITWLFLSWNVQSVKEKLSPPGYCQHRVYNKPETKYYVMTRSRTKIMIRGCFKVCLLIMSTKAALSVNRETHWLLIWHPHRWSEIVIGKSSKNAMFNDFQLAGHSP